MQAIGCLLFALLLVGCITAYEREPSGIYPDSAASLNGPPIYFIGRKFTFDLPVERFGKQ
jgi:hypothetical protein